MDETFFAVQRRMSSMGFNDAAASLWQRWSHYTQKEREFVASKWLGGKV